MNKKEFLGASLHNGLKFKHRIALGYNYSDPQKTTIDYDYAIDEMHGVNLNKVLYGPCYGAEFDNVELILRPLSDLTKPITHNGKTFVPLVELAKIADMNVTDDFKCVDSCNAWGVRFRDEDDECVFYEILAYSSNTNSFSTQTIQGEDIISERVSEMTFNQLQLFQKLIEWHFNLMDESEPFIPVTEEFNPYK